MKRLMTLALGGLMLAGSPLDAADPDAGRKLAGMCRTCHGIDGYARVPIAPHIGGEPQDYLETQLMAFKTGAREHEMMTVVAAGLSAEQIADVAAWYAAQTVVATLPDGTSPDAAPQACVSCHGTDGIATFAGAPNLAGETNIYIETQLKAFRIGKRAHDIMSPIAEGMTDAEMREVADWYAAVSLEISGPAD
ncbi:c-type cytochrome [Poseidonocella sedimentorum]|uniref:Cytochrome c553 n=1 Tax=Poseidonocella sedimentorum TaxID=871652 RepID=A0A1I6DVV3_9RHOB|nr:c-type cytochrome [Poseidonocella sedimentorum]SFR09565.1 Cytochrome c553 [Poseidonocella sedimentorum]